MDIEEAGERSHRDPWLPARIRAARVLCIFFVMFVHVYSGYELGEESTRPYPLFHAVYILLIDVLGRGSVPLLTIISGYLVVQTYERLRYPALLRKKAGTLVAPLLLWNILFLLLTFAYEFAHGDSARLPDPGVRSYLDALLAFSAPAINTPISFLRDIFVLMLFTPLLYAAISRAPIVTLSVLLTIAVFDLYAPLVLRPQMPMFFALGLYLRRRGLEGIDRFGWAFVIGAASAYVVRKAHFTQAEEVDRLLHYTIRFCLAGAFWAVTGPLVTSRLGRFVDRLEPSIFVTFCSHFITFKLLAALLGPMFGKYGDPLYPIFFFIQVPIGLGVAFVLVALFGDRRWFVPFNGGRRVVPASAREKERGARLA